MAAEAGKVVGGNPRRLLDVARDVIERKVPAECVLGSITNRDAAIAKLGRPEAMLATELDALGAAAASDDALLSRLGWTRSRAVQVFTRGGGRSRARRGCAIRAGPTPQDVPADPAGQVLPKPHP